MRWEWDTGTIWETLLSSSWVETTILVSLLAIAVSGPLIWTHDRFLKTASRKGWGSAPCSGFWKNKVSNPGRAKTHLQQKSRWTLITLEFCSNVRMGSLALQRNIGTEVEDLLLRFMLKLSDVFSVHLAHCLLAFKISSLGQNAHLKCSFAFADNFQHFFLFFLNTLLLAFRKT